MQASAAGLRRAGFRPSARERPGEPGPAHPRHPAVPGRDYRGRCPRCLRPDQPRRGTAAGPDRASGPAALLRPGQAVPQGGAGAGGLELGLPGRAVRRHDLLPDRAAADPRADHVRAPAGLYGRHSRWRVHLVAGQLHGGCRRAGQRQSVRAARCQPGQDIRRHHRAGGAVRRLHGRAGDGNRPALCAGPDRAACPSARGGRPVHGHPLRDRPDPGRNSYRDHRVRDDRGGPSVRAFRPVLRAAALGLGHEAADPLHDPAERVRSAMGAGVQRARQLRADRDRGADRQGRGAGRGGGGHRQLVRQAAPVQDHGVRGGRVPARRARRPDPLPGRWLMSGITAATVAAPSALSGGASVIAVGVLLAEFGMFRQALLRDQIRLYGAQSALISVLAVVAAATRHLPDLYALAALSFALKAVIVPLVLGRILRRIDAGTDDPRWSDIAGSGTVSLATTVLVAIAVAAFGFFAVSALGIHSPVLPATALSISAGVILVAFVLMIMRRDVISQGIGFLSLENGISLSALVVAAGLPLILEVAFLFDLLVVVVVFGLLIRVHHGKAESMSTTGLTSLRG